MDELDGDGAMLKDNDRRECSRDIVQFVSFKNAVARGNLAEQVLKEIPRQVCSFMELINYRP